MGELHFLAFEDEREDIKEQVKEYWTERADGFFELRHDEIESSKADRWRSEIGKALKKAGVLTNEDIAVDKNEGKRLTVLDLGCGTGFFEVLLGGSGHRIHGVDLTEEMIVKANEMIETYQLDSDNVTAQVGAAEKPDLADESFDVLITRNLTWTLPHPVEAYQEWYRLLKKGGVLMNFGAEYAKGAHNLKNPENLAHRKISDGLKDKCHDIYHMLTISTLDRPEWDQEILTQIGFRDVEVDKEFGGRIFIERDEFYIPDHMFSIVAVK